MTAAPVAIVLPPNEGFAPGAVGAIGLLVHRLVRAGGGGVVIGAPTSTPSFPGVRFVPAAPGFGLSRTARYVSGVVRVLRGMRPALIEVHNRPEVALGLAARLPGIPVVLWLNNDPQGMRRARTARDRAVLLSRMARVITASDWIRRRLLDGVPSPFRPPVVLPNCIDLPTPLPGPREQAFVFAGRVVADKGVDAFVAACGEVLPHLPGWRALVIGADRFSLDAPDTNFLRTLRMAASAAGVEMVGYRPHAEVMAAMSRAAVVAVPSRWEEPFGLAALEALACGAALVCSARGGLPEVAGDAAIYADPDKRGALRLALMNLAVDPARRSDLSTAGRIRAATFSADRAATALLALRQKILEGV